jgi:hypothetical protein
VLATVLVFSVLGVRHGGSGKVSMGIGSGVEVPTPVLSAGDEYDAGGISEVIIRTLLGGEMQMKVVYAMTNTTSRHVHRLKDPIELCWKLKKV